MKMIRIDIAQIDQQQQQKKMYSIFLDCNLTIFERNQSKIINQKWSEKRFFLNIFIVLYSLWTIYFQKNNFIWNSTKNIISFWKYQPIKLTVVIKNDQPTNQPTTTTTRQPSENKNLVIVCMSVCVCIVLLCPNKMVSRSDCHRHRCRRRGYLFMNEDDS